MLALANRLVEKARATHDAIGLRLDRLGLVHDLAEDIGSARWFRGLGALLGLGVVALSFWPDLTQVEAATGLPVDRTTRDQFRAQMILPLALGGDSGSRMAPGPAVVNIAQAPERPRIALAAVLAQGDSLGGMLRRAGLAPAEAARTGELVAGAVPPGQIGAGTRFAIVLGRRPAEGQPRVLENLAFRASFDLDLEVARRDGALVLERRRIAVDDTPLRITGRVGASLYRSARSAGAPAGAVQQYLRELDSRVDLESGLEPDDRFDIVVRYRRSAAGEIQAGDLLYAGLARAGKPRVQLVRWGGDGRFLDAGGLGQPAQGLILPVAGRLTSGFGMRQHPILGYTRMHAGVDFGAAWGSPIHAVTAGVVDYAGRHGGHGNYVRLQHGGGIGSGYAHLSRIAVSPGESVRAGQVIGYVGSTGLSTGPHLHYEVYRDGRTVDPLSVRFTFSAGIDRKAQAAFKARLRELTAIRPGKALQPLAAGKPGTP